MGRLNGILLLVLLSVVYCSATKVCLLRKSEQLKCSVRGVHLDETETALFKDLCAAADHPINILTTRGAKVDEQVFDCGQHNSYVWIPWNDFLSTVKPMTNGNGFREGNVYFGRNQLHEQDEPTTEFCRIDLKSGHCVALAGNQSQNIISTEVLVQRLPIHYDLKIVHVGAWKNITEGEHVSLATTHLYNRQSDNQFVQKVIPYDLEREVQFDPLPEDLLRDVKVNVYDEAGRLDLRFDVGDAATTLISKSVPAIKRLLPRTSIEVSVQGRNDRVLSKVNGDLITVFDRADNDNAALVQRFTKNLVLNRIEIGVQEVEVEFGVIQKLDPNAEIEDNDYPSVEEAGDGATSSDSEPQLPDNSIALFQNKTVYPGFHTISTVAYMIFCTTFVVTMFDVVRQLRKNFRLKRKAYGLVATEEPLAKE